MTIIRVLEWSKDYKEYYINADNIKYITRDGDFVKIFFIDETSLKVNTSLKQILSQLGYV
jgi:DNA-binding LytR/AlgR family response regulator